MDVLGITDIHSNIDTYRQILSREPEADLLVLGGDLTNFGTVEEAENIVDLAKEHTDQTLAVAGNCDSSDIDRMLSERNLSVHAEGKRFNEYGVFGVSAMPVWNNTMYEFSEEEIDTYLQTGYEQVKDTKHTLLVSHTPPRDSGVDETSSGEAVGSTSVSKWVEKIQPVLVLSGHVHEARGTVTDTSTIVNCGPARDGFYARITIHAPDDVEVNLKSQNG